MSILKTIDSPADLKRVPVEQLPLLAEEIRAAIKTRTGLTASVGIGPNKLLAKIASNFRKPDADIFRIALDIAQVPAGQVVYVDDRAMFVQVAEGLEIRGILHTDYNSTCAKLAAFGLQNGEHRP